MFAAEAFSDVLVVDGCALLMMLHEFLPALPKNIRIYKCFLLPSATHPFLSWLFPYAFPPTPPPFAFALQNICKYSYDYRSLLWACV